MESQINNINNNYSNNNNIYTYTYIYNISKQILYISKSKNIDLYSAYELTNIPLNFDIIKSFIFNNPDIQYDK